jgi:hypothetical protein
MSTMRAVEETDRNLSTLLNEVSDRPELLDPLVDILVAARFSPAALGKLASTAPEILQIQQFPVSLLTAAESYRDNRSNSLEHPAIGFAIVLERDFTLSQALDDCLGRENSKKLIHSFCCKLKQERKAVLDTVLPRRTHVTLILDSGSKEKDRPYELSLGNSDPKKKDKITEMIAREWGPSNVKKVTYLARLKTTQWEDLKASGLTFADDFHAATVCAVAVKIAREAGLDLRQHSSLWAKKQADALVQLQQCDKSGHISTLLSHLSAGTIRSKHGQFSITNAGELQNSYDYKDASKKDFAFGTKAHD